MIDTSNLKLTNKKINSFFKEYENSFFSYLKKKNNFKIHKKIMKNKFFKSILIFTEYLIYLYTNDKDLNLSISQKFLINWNSLNLSILLLVSNFTNPKKNTFLNEFIELKDSKNIKLDQYKINEWFAIIENHKKEINNYILNLYQIVDFEVEFNIFSETIIDVICILLCKNNNFKKVKKLEKEYSDEQILNYLNLFKNFRQNIIKLFPTFFNHLVYIINCQ